MKATGRVPKTSYCEIFEDAVNYFLRCMRSNHAVIADALLDKKYGDELHTHVTAWCFNMGVTKRLKNGNLVLADKYKKPTAIITIGGKK